MVNLERRDKILYRKECLIAGKGGRISEHRFLLYQKIGPGPHSCTHCGSGINWMPGRKTAQGALIVDHLDGNHRNNDINNLVPSCHGCNINRGRGDQLIKDGEIFVVQANGRRARAVELICHHCGSTYHRTIAQAKTVNSRFCSSSCRSTAVNHERAAAGLYKKK